MNRKGSLFFLFALTFIIAMFVSTVEINMADAADRAQAVIAVK